MLSSRKPLLVCLVTSGALLFLGTLGTLALGACNKDPPAAARTSRRGEVCRVTSDCAEGLACAPIVVVNGGMSPAGGICVTAIFHVRPTAKECAIVECAQSIDCCDDPAGNCPRLREQCIGNDAGATSRPCQDYHQLCGCETGATLCEVGKCVSHCQLDEECSNRGLKRCSGGNCVQCATDPDCGPGGKQCVTGVCQVACTNDGDCTGFDRCLFGRCIASGCQVDRECVAVTGNVDARCGTDGKCIVPCETDLECGKPTDYKFFSCIEKQCTYVGCESDKDCRYFFLGDSGASFGPKRHAVCRDKGIIGDVKKPAQ